MLLYGSPILNLGNLTTITYNKLFYIIDWIIRVPGLVSTIKAYDDGCSVVGGGGGTVTVEYLGTVWVW